MYAFTCGLPSGHNNFVPRSDKSTQDRFTAAIMKPWAVILIIIIVLLTSITLCIVYGKRVIRLMSHNLAVSQAQAEARDEEARVELSAQRLASHVRDLNAIVAAQETGLDAQARILAQHGVVLPGRVYQVPPRGEGEPPQFFRLEPVQPAPAEGAQGGGNSGGNAGGKPAA